MITYLFYFGVALNLFAEFGPALTAAKAVPKEVKVGVLLPTVTVDGRLFDQTVRAVRMAFDEINKDTSILPNTWIRVVVNSTGYDRWQAIEAALWQANVARVVSIVGAADASEVKVISPIVKEGDIPLISPSTVEYEIDSETLYPTFFRVGPPDRRLGRAVKAILDHYSWKKIAVIHSDDDYGVNGVRSTIDMARALRYYDIASVYLEEPHGPQLTESESQAIRRLKERGFRIFVVVLHAGEQAAVLRVASEIGMFEEGFAWVIAHCRYGTDLFVPGKMDGIICIKRQTDDIVANKLYKQMQSSQYRGSESRMWIESVYAYNAANGIAQALNAILPSGSTEELFDDNDKRTGIYPDYRPFPTPIGFKLLDVFRTKSFTDETGSFNFYNTSRNVNYEYLNYHDGQLIQFATYKEDFLLNNESNSDKQMVHFPGNKTIVPLDIPAKHTNTLRVLVPISFPFTDFVEEKTNKTCVNGQDHTTCKFIGVAIQLMQKITSQIGLGVNFTLWTKSWNELVKQVGNESSEWDIAAGSVTITSLRSQHAIFSSSIYDSGLRILTLRPPVAVKGYFEFFKPFSWLVWLLIIMTLLSAAIVMLYMDPEAVNTGLLRAYPDAGKWNRRLHKWADAVYFSCCVFFAVHRVDNINHLFSRIYIAVLCFWVLIMVSAYTANMAAFLTHRHGSQSIYDYKDLPNVPVGCRSGTSNWDYVNNELSLKNVIDVKDGHHAVQLLKGGVIKAYIADTPHVLGLAATDCDVVVVGSQEQHQKYAFPMKPSLSYHNQINKAILEAVEKEYVTDTFDRILNSQCPSLPQQDTIRSITLQDIGGLFMLAGVAGALLILLKFIFLLWRKCYRTSKEIHRKKSEQKMKANNIAGDEGLKGTYYKLSDLLLEEESDSEIS
jgi:ABC-type branched-subunit amino acid transport system substrate-binding protein/ABC-type amino acid transport substrate-binding protein